MGREDVWTDVLKHVDADMVTELARGALRIASISGEETPVAQYFEAEMRRVGMETELQAVAASDHMGPSTNAIGRLRGSGGGQSVMFNGHMDHNPVSDGWTKDPFGGVVENGWLYGFVHMKAANACYIAAVDAVRKSGIGIKGDITLANVCGELREPALACPLGSRPTGSCWASRPSRLGSTMRFHL